MWLPKPVYDKAPHYWLWLGLLFVIFGAYLGLQDEMIYSYIGIPTGVLCCAWSRRVFMQRAANRRAQLLDAG